MEEGLPLRTLKVIECASRLNRRVTASDVAMSTGLSLADAESELVYLTNKTGGHLEVSKHGDIVYAFPMGFRQALVLDPIEAAVRTFISRTFKTAWWIFRMYFGTMLIASICISFCIIAVFLLRFMDNLDLGNFGGGGGGGGGGKKKASTGKSGTVSLGASSDKKSSTSAASKKPENSAEFVELRHLYSHKLAEVEQLDLNALGTGEASDSENMDNGRQMPAFFKEVFAYLFGNENPNKLLEDKRWSLIAQLILSRHGVLTAPELAPFLDVDPTKAADEKFVLPVLARYKGRARLTEGGHMVYVFEPSNVSAVAGIASTPLPVFLEEKAWTIEYPWYIAALVVTNVALALIAIPVSLAFGPLWLPISFMLFLNALFFVGLNWSAKAHVDIQNNLVQERNQRRLQCIKQMLDPKNEIEIKLREASVFRVEKAIISEQDIVYRTDADIVEQAFEMKPGEKADRIIKQDRAEREQANVSILNEPDHLEQKFIDLEAPKKIETKTEEHVIHTVDETAKQKESVERS